MIDFAWILKTLLNLEFSIFAVVISTVAFANCARERQIGKITRSEDRTPRNMIGISQVKAYWNKLYKVEGYEEMVAWYVNGKTEERNRPHCLFAQ
jgi:hypothetical protein